MVAHDHDLLFRIFKQAGATRAFLLEGQAAVIVVDHIAVIKHAGILIHRRQGAVRERGQGGGIGGMHMHGAACVFAMAM